LGSMVRTWSMVLVWAMINAGDIIRHRIHPGSRVFIIGFMAWGVSRGTGFMAG
jgi:hypothetical protein